MCVYLFVLSEPINIFFGVYKTDSAPLRLSYHGSIHYNSVVDPYNATVGVGLGLAGFKPGVRCGGKGCDRFKWGGEGCGRF